jgi:phosphoglycerate dehydrogenase-like enzyme
VFITPHVAGSTPASAERALRLVRDQLQRYLRGDELRNVVTGRY